MHLIDGLEVVKKSLKTIGWWLAGTLVTLGPIMVYRLTTEHPDVLTSLLFVALGAWFYSRLHKILIHHGGYEIADVVSDVLLAPEHKYSKVNASDFTWLDLGFYERTSNTLSRLGFDVIADIEDLTLSKGIPENRSFFRAFVSRSGETIALCCHLKSRGLDALIARLLSSDSGNQFFVEFVSSTSDYSTVLDTMNTTQASVDSPPWYDELKLAADTPIYQLHEAHERRTQAFFDSHPNKQPIRVTGYADLVQVIREGERRKYEWRKQRGGVTREELTRIGSDSGLDREALKVADAMERDGLLGRDNDR